MASPNTYASTLSSSPVTVTPPHAAGAAVADVPREAWPLALGPASGSTADHGNGGAGKHAVAVTVALGVPVEGAPATHANGARGTAISSSSSNSGSSSSSSSSSGSGGIGGADALAPTAGDIHERNLLPPLVETPLEDVLVRSSISALPPSQQYGAIVSAFNSHLPGGRLQALTLTRMPGRGERIQQGHYMLAHRNFVSELCPYSEQRIAVQVDLTPGVQLDVIGVFQQLAPFYGAHGVFVVNVPLSKYAKVWFGQIPKLLDAGTHVIHDVTFRLALDERSNEPVSCFVDVSSPEIRHGTIHLLRIPVNSLAKVWVNATTPSLLYSRGDGRPYVVNNPLFRIDGYALQTEPYIKHGSIHVIRVGPGQLGKVTVNNRPELLPSRREPYVYHCPVFEFNPRSGLVSTLEPVISHGVTHILRIPAGFVCKVWQGTEPLLLESRVEPYVFDSPLFKLDDPTDPFCDINEPYIRHQCLHRLRVPAGKVARIWQGAKPMLLQSQEKHIEFNSAFFRLAPTDRRALDAAGQVRDHMPAEWLYVDAFAPYIRHGTLHVLRVPSGMLAKVWDGARAILLESQPETYTFDSPVFRLAGIESALEKAKAVKRARVKEAAAAVAAAAAIKKPATKASSSAAVSASAALQSATASGPDATMDSVLGDEDMLDDLDAEDIFCDATDRAIVHGSLKRLQPRTGEVCLTYDSGQLVIREPARDGKPLLLNNENMRVEGFLSVGVQTLVFPSEETKLARRAENPDLSTDEACLEIFRTKDSLRVGVKLLVAFRISDPYKAVTMLSRDGIIKHVEHSAVVDMGKAIQQCTSRDFLASTYSNAGGTATAQPGRAQAGTYAASPFGDSSSSSSSSSMSPSVSGACGVQSDGSLLEHFQDTIKVALAADLAEYGIELVRLNFETPKILDAKISSQMAEHALSVAAVSAQESVMKQKAEIARVQAEQEATVKRIAQDQQNANAISVAKARKDAAQLEADACVIEAEGRHRAAQLEGAQYSAHPPLLQLKLAEISASAMSAAKISMVVAPEQVGHALSMFNNFGQMASMMQQPPHAAK